MGISQLVSREKVSKRLREKIDRIVAHVAIILQPDAIYIFGSMYNGEVHADSDLDLLAVMDHSSPRQNLATKVLASRPHKDVPLDLHIVSAKNFEEMKGVGGLCFEAHNYGKVVYGGPNT